MEEYLIKYVRYFTQDSITVVLNTNGFSWHPQRQYFEEDLQTRKIFFLEYVAPFTRAVEVASLRFRYQINRDCDIWQRTFRKVSESERKKFIFFVFSIAKLSHDKRYKNHESLFIVMAAAGEMCVRYYLCYPDIMADIVTSTTVFLMGLLKTRKLNVKESTSTFLQVYDTQLSSESEDCSDEWLTTVK